MMQGYNGWGNIGSSACTVGSWCSAAPQPVASGFVSLSLGQYHSCGLMTNATIYCWGYNNQG